MTEKIFNHRNYHSREDSLIVFSTPKNGKNGLLMSRASYLEDDERVAICFETEYFHLMNGVQRSKEGTSYIDLIFDERNQAFYEFVDELDELSKSRTWENCRKWFGHQLELDVIDDWYKTPIKSSSKTPNYMRFGLDLENLIIKNQFGTLVDLHLLENGKVKLKVSFEGISFYQQTFKPVYKVMEINVYQQNRIEDEDSFYSHNNSYPGFRLNNLGNESDPEEDYLFEKHNEEDIQKLTKPEEVSVYDEQEQEFEHVENDSEEVKQSQDSENIGDNFEEIDENQGILEEEKPLGDLFRENVEGKRTNTPTEPEDVQEIISKTLTKVSELSLPMDEPTFNCNPDENDTIEDLRRKLLLSQQKVQKYKTEKSVDSITSDSKSKTRKLLLNNDKVKTVTLPKSLE